MSMDPLSSKLIEKAANDALGQIMAQRLAGGRIAMVVVLAADGPHAALSQAYSKMNSTEALQFAGALHAFADEVALNAHKGILDAHERAAIKQARI